MLAAQKQRLDELADSVELPDEFTGIPTFVVGGAVRDALLGVSSSDVDLMVAEVSPEEMRERGFKEIDSPNNDTFAVFQDSLGREVAIARREISTGPGHTDFTIEPIDESVRAGEAVWKDLQRRDFRVNAMALDVKWNVFHDPFNGLQDLNDEQLEAVDSTAFVQDPLRVVRGARFAAQLGFDIEESTFMLMCESSDKLETLPAERVRLEMEKALVRSEHPRTFFDILSKIDALSNVAPALSELQHIPAGPEEFHNEGDAFEHTMMVLEEMNELRPGDELALLMALAHDFGKVDTPDENLPNHPGHEKSTDPIREMVTHLRMSREKADAMIEASRFHMRLHNMDDLRESTVIKMFTQTRFVDKLIDLGVADSRGRRPQGEFDRELAESRLAAAEQAVEEWSGARLIEEGYSPDEMGGSEFGDLLHQKRVERMREIEQ